MTKPNIITAAALLIGLAWTGTAFAQDGHGMPCPYEKQKDVNADAPKPVIRHRVFDKKFLFVTALSVGVSIATTATITRCRRDHGIGPCADGGYGPYQARETIRQGATFFLILPSYKIKRIEDEDRMKHKFWWVFPAFNAGWNSAPIILNARKHYGPREKD